MKYYVKGEYYIEEKFVVDLKDYTEKKFVVDKDNSIPREL